MQKNAKRWAALAIALMMALTFLTACGGTPSSSQPAAPASSQPAGEPAPAPADDGGEQTVRMWTFLDPEADNGRAKALKQMIETFEAENPGIKIVVEPQDWEQMTPKFFAAHAAGNAPDIIWCIMDEMGAALDLGALEPLENLFLKDWTDE